MTLTAKVTVHQTTTSKNLLALDIGNRRIGVAVAGVEARLPRPLQTLDKDNNILERLKEIIDQQNVDILVLGLPKNLNGQETDQTILTRKFADELIKRVNTSFYWQNEALSSVRAKQELAGRKKKFDKSEIDSLAAVYILDDFINENKDLIDEISNQ